MSGGRKGKKRGRGPAEEESDRVREERAGPAEVSFYVTVAVETRPSFSSERAGEKEREE